MSGVSHVCLVMVSSSGEKEKERKERERPKETSRDKDAREGKKPIKQLIRQSETC